MVLNQQSYVWQITFYFIMFCLREMANPPFCSYNEETAQVSCRGPFMILWILALNNLGKAPEVRPLSRPELC